MPHDDNRQLAVQDLNVCYRSCSLNAIMIREDMHTFSNNHKQTISDAVRVGYELQIGIDNGTGLTCLSQPAWTLKQALADECKLYSKSPVTLPATRTYQDYAHVKDTLRCVIMLYCSYSPAVSSTLDGRRTQPDDHEQTRPDSARTNHDLQRCLHNDSPLLRLSVEPFLGANATSDD